MMTMMTMMMCVHTQKMCVCAFVPNHTNRRTTETESIFTHNNSIEKKLNEEQTTDQKNENNNSEFEVKQTQKRGDPQFNK